MAQEQQEYIQTKVNPTLENLVTQVLLERPENPVPFMVKWLANQTQQAKDSLATMGVGEAEKLRSEIHSLQEEVRELEAKVRESAGAGASASRPAVAPAPKEKDNEAFSDEDEEEDDDVDDSAMPMPPASYMHKGQRSSVSAEAYGDWNKVKEFKPPVHPKTEEQAQRIGVVLRQSFLFGGLDKQSVDIITGAMVEKSVPAGERIIQAGDDGDVMFVIERGAVDCLKKINDEEKVVKQCSAGDFFGELALLYNCPRAASVQATEECLLWQLDRETFNYIVKDASMKRRQTYEDFLKSVPLLEKLGSYERAQLAEVLQKETVVAGSTVITQGEEGSRFYLVEEGELVAKKSAPGEEPKDVLTYKRGDYFGELALLRNDVRAATVVSVVESTILWVDRRNFKALLGPLEGLLEEKAAEYRK